MGTLFNAHFNDNVDTKINLCDTCKLVYGFPVCIPSDAEFGDGIGNDNICKCSKYENRPSIPEDEEEEEQNPDDPDTSEIEC